jgi:hypothetical protein
LLVIAACPEKLENVDALIVEYEGREELLVANLTRMLANKRNSQDDSADRRSTATFDDVYDSSYRRSTATFDYDYSSAPGQTPTTTTRDGAVAITDMPPAIMEGGDDAESQSSSSSVGSSEWSSDDGLSSIDATSVTMSDGRSMSPDTAAAALAAISDASALNSQLENRHLVPTSTVDTNLDNPNGGNQATRTLTEEATQDDLDKAIEAGDWRAVSATAALIANSYPTESTDFDESDHSQLSKSAQNQVEEFEQLVEDGNWDAVIAAATRIESATSDVESLNESWLSAQDESTPNSEGHRHHPDQHADLANKSQEELIAEIKVLVEEVVPDELGK